MYETLFINQETKIMRVLKYIRQHPRNSHRQYRN